MLLVMRAFTLAKNDWVRSSSSFWSWLNLVNCLSKLVAELSMRILTSSLCGDEIGDVVFDDEHGESVDDVICFLLSSFDMLNWFKWL